MASASERKRQYTIHENIDGNPVLNLSNGHNLPITAPSPPSKRPNPTITTMQPKIWTTLASPILTTPNTSLKLTWHLQNTATTSWSSPIIFRMLVCKSSPASAMFGSWTESQIPGEQVLLRMKFDLDAHEGRYDYMTETVYDEVVPGESLDVVAEFTAPDEIGRYWGCFKILTEDEKEFFCAFRLSVLSQFDNLRIAVRDEIALNFATAKGLNAERTTLETMLAEQPWAPTSVMDMVSHPLDAISTNTYQDPSWER